MCVSVVRVRMCIFVYIYVCMCICVCMCGVCKDTYRQQRKVIGATGDVVQLSNQMIVCQPARWITKKWLTLLWPLCATSLLPQ